MMRTLDAVILLSAACGGSKQPAALPSSSAPTPPAAAPDVPTDCPYGVVDEWAHELWPACAPSPLPAYAPLCPGAACDARPCAATIDIYTGAHKEHSNVYELTYTYDATGRFVGAKTPTEEWARCTYEDGRLQRCTSLQAVVHEVERDASGRIRAYIENGHRDGIEYDTGGRVTSVGDNRFVYDDRGWLVAERHKGDEQLVEHDEHGRMTRVRALELTYEDGHIVSIHRPRPDGELLLFDPYDESIAYDAQGRVIEDSVVTANGDATTRYRYECR